MAELKLKKKKIEMELKLNLEYSDILELIKQLPANQIMQLKSDLDNELKNEKTPSQVNSIQSLLLNGPVMGKDQYEDFVENRKFFGLWRTN